MFLFSGDAHLVLADGKKVVVSRIRTIVTVYIRPVDQTHRAVHLTGFFVIGRQAFRDAVVDFLVVFENLPERMRIVLHLPTEVINLHFVQPRIKAFQGSFQA